MATVPRRARGRQGLSCRQMRNGMIDLEHVPEKAFLVAVDTGDDAGWSAEDSLAELTNLASTAGADELGITVEGAAAAAWAGLEAIPRPAGPALLIITGSNT